MKASLTKAEIKQTVVEELPGILESDRNVRWYLLISLSRFLSR